MILPAESLPIDHYTLAELITLRDRINSLLPNADSLNLQQELILQFISAKELFKRAQLDDETPLNQVAQVINSTTAILKQLTDAQIKLYTAERNRALEQALIELLKESDPEACQEFMEEYTKRLEAIGQ